MAQQYAAAVAACVAVLAEAFGRTPSPTTFRAYEWGLDGLTPIQIEQAARQALRTCRFMPSPSELRELVSGSLADRAEQAWLLVCLAVERLGHRKSVDFGDPAIHAAIRSLGGWEHICTLSADEFDRFLQPRFVRAYIAFCRSGVGGDAGRPLLGLTDRENSLLGFDQQPAVKVQPLLAGCWRDRRLEYSDPVERR